MQMKDRIEIDDWMLKNPEASLGAVIFFLSQNLKKIDFTIQSNSTTKYFKNEFQHPSFFFQVPMQIALEREISRFHMMSSDESEIKAIAENLEWSVGYKNYPHPAFETESVVGSILGPFLFAANMFGFVSQMTFILSEKQIGMKRSLKTMGMLDSSYWLSWAIWDLCLIILTTLLNIVFGYMFQFRFFLKNSFLVIFLLFFLFQMSMSSFALFSSVFVTKVSSATIIGFSLFIIGWITYMVILFDIPYSPKYYTDIVPVTAIFTAMPWNPFMKVILINLKIKRFKLIGSDRFG